MAPQKRARRHDEDEIIGVESASSSLRQDIVSIIHWGYHYVCILQIADYMT